MATLTDIKSPVWTLSSSGRGAVAEGLAAIRQCIDIIIRTTKRTDPLRPEFGSDVYKYVDYPVNIAIPNIKKAILEAIGTWEKRVNISQIKHDIKESQLFFDIGYTLTDGTLTDSILVTVSSEGIITGGSIAPLILQGYFPPNPSNYLYQLSCILDNEAILPLPPEEGFADVFELYDWVQSNWLNYGKWYLTADAIVGYINSDYSTGSLSISVLQLNRFQGGVPTCPIGYKYQVNIVLGGATVTNINTDLFTADQILDWVKNEGFLGGLGIWKLVNTNGAFSDDFNDDFLLYNQLLQLYTSKANNVVIDITTIPQ